MLPNSSTAGLPIWRRALAFLLAALQTFLPVLPSLAQAQTPSPIVADPTVRGQRPVANLAANGVPVVQIVPPNAAGISNNRFLAFNADSRGLILNNSGAMQQTQLAGWVAGNPMLGNASARLIINQVTGSAPSVLAGHTEVAGPAANLVIANPNGISCKGCGFINAPQVTLSTGEPLLGADGSFNGLRVTRGEIAIAGDGMYARNLDRLVLASRSLRVDGDLRATQLLISTGAAELNAAFKVAPVVGEDGQDIPAVRLDVSALGGLYADAIHLVGTGAGPGVRSAGAISAMAGDLRISEAGELHFVSGKLTLKAAQESSERSSDGSASNFAFGMSVDKGGASPFKLSGGRSSSTADGSETRMVNSHIVADGKLTISSGEPLSLRGGVIYGGQVELHTPEVEIASLQDTAQYDGQSKSMGGSIAYGSGGSLNFGRSDVKTTYASVVEQSAIRAGDGGYQIYVPGLVKLEGGVISSSQAALDSGANVLEYGRLEMADIRNSSTARAKAYGVTLGVGDMKGAAGGVGKLNGADESITYSAVNVANDAPTSRTLARNPDGSALAEKVDAAVTIMQSFTAAMPRAVAELAGSRQQELLAAASMEVDPAKQAALRDEAAKWAEGGSYRIALHTASGALGGGLAGAAGGYATASAAPALNEIQAEFESAFKKAGIPDGDAQMVAQGLMQIAAAGLGQAAGGAAGAVTALSTDSLNRQLHPEEKVLARQIAEKSGGKYTAEQVEAQMRGMNLAVGDKLELGISDTVVGGVPAMDKGGTWLYAGTTSEGKPIIAQQIAANDADLRVFIVANTPANGEFFYPGTYKPAPTPVSADTLPPAPPGTRRATIFVGGQPYFPLVADCPASSCTNGNPLAFAIPDAGTREYLEADARRQERTLNIVTAVTGGAGAIVRAADALSTIANASSSAIRASQLSEVYGAVPFGFKSAEEFSQFGKNVRAGLERAGYVNAEPMLQGSAVTGKKFTTGEPFDFGRVSDFDIAVIDPGLVSRAGEIGLKLRSGGTRTGPIPRATLNELGLGDLSVELSQQVGRKVEFMFFSNPELALGKAPSVTLPKGK